MIDDGRSQDPEFDPPFSILDPRPFFFYSQSLGPDADFQAE